MALYSVSLQVTNTSNNSPVVGANVFINGTIPSHSSIVTGTTGTALIQLVANSGNVTLQVTATGFQSSTQVVNTSPTPPLSIQVSLTPATVQSSVITFQFTPPQPGITWQLTQSSNPIDNSVSTSDGTSASNIPILYGTYNVSAALTGYQALSQPIIINGQTSAYPLILVAIPNTDSVQQGNTNGNSTALTTTSSSILSTTSVIAPVATDYVYPTTEFDKYFTITGVCIYIGNLFIDEVNTLQYALQDNAIPIYGYASRYVDAYGQGRSLVQGQLTLNFVTEGYLYTVMNEYQQYIATNKSLPTLALSGTTAVDQALGLMTTRDSYVAQMNNNPNSAAVAQVTGTNPTTLVASLNTQLLSLFQSMTPAQITDVSTKRQAQQTGSTDVISFDNAIYKDVLFDIRITMGNEQTGVQRTRYIETVSY